MSEPVVGLVERIMNESPIGLSEAARFFGTFRQGRPTSPATLYRWCVNGLKLPGDRKVFLEHIRIGNRLMTSRAACMRFIEAQQDPPPADAPKDPKRSDESQKKSSDQAGEWLKKQGA